MSTEDFNIELFRQVDDAKFDATKDSQATLFSEVVVALAVLFICSQRAWQSGFLSLADKQLAAFLSQSATSDTLVSFVLHASPLVGALYAGSSLIGVIDSYGIELIHPRRKGRSPQQIGKKGLSNQRWIIGENCVCC